MVMVTTPRSKNNANATNGQVYRCIFVLNVRLNLQGAAFWHSDIQFFCISIDR